jgi:hypothetical protein
LGVQRFGETLGVQRFSFGETLGVQRFSFGETLGVQRFSFVLGVQLEKIGVTTL